MGIRLTINNFRCLRSVDWSPDGVCILVGPNGSGKTTLFDSLNFLRQVYLSDVNQAVASSGGAFFRNIDAPPGEDVTFTLSQGTCKWSLGVSFSAGPFNLSVNEVMTEGAEVIFEKNPQNFTYRFQGQVVGMQPHNSFLRFLSNVPTTQFTPSKSLIRFLSTVNGFTTYGSYQTQQLRQGGSPVSVDMQLSPTGHNAFAVLRNWRDKRDYRTAYDFVTEQLYEAFPGVADEVEFDFAGTITSLRLVNRKQSETIPVTFAPHGWLVGLLHLMCVASAPVGTVVSIDEFENSLHPYAIRRLVQAMRDWAAKRQLTIILAGHSPALLDEFHECPSQVFVMESVLANGHKLPIRLTEYRDPEWLKHFSLGELYRHDEFGGPKDASLDSQSIGAGSKE